MPEYWYLFIHPKNRFTRWYNYTIGAYQMDHFQSGWMWDTMCEAEAQRAAAMSPEVTYLERLEEPDGAPEWFVDQLAE